MYFFLLVSELYHIYEYEQPGEKKRKETKNIRQIDWYVHYTVCDLFNKRVCVREILFGVKPSIQHHQEPRNDGRTDVLVIFFILW